ncbi:MAG: hypothetical protein JO119_07005 [Acidobacteria bacterium]|nr:hypothetical protein [Acidobacteriota bacterium]
MQTFEIPVANLTIKLVIIPACLLIAGVVLWWAIPKFAIYLRVLTGREPRKPGTQTVHLVLGLFVYLLIFLPAVISIVILIEITTTPPSIVSGGGVVGGGGLLSSRKTIAWNEVTRADCLMTRGSHKISNVRLTAASKRIELGGGVELEPIHDFIWAHLPPPVTHPCTIPFRSSR